MDRAETMAKIRDLQAVAKRATIEGEADAARNRAEHLKAKYGITDADLEASAYVEVDGIFGGKVSIFPYYEQVGVKVRHIKDLITMAQAAIDGIPDKGDRVRYSCQLYKDLQELLDTGSYGDRRKVVKVWRDKAIKAFYQAKYDEYMAKYGDRNDVLVSQWYAHEDALRQIKYLNSDLRKDTIERVAGVKGADLWAKYVKAQEQARANQAQVEGGAG
jgi:hypothetical protein